MLDAPGPQEAADSGIMYAATKPALEGFSGVGFVDGHGTDLTNVVDIRTDIWYNLTNICSINVLNIDSAIYPPE